MAFHLTKKGLLLTATGLLDSEAQPFGCSVRLVFHCGGVGAVQTIKLVNNVIAVANVLVTGEAYRLALDNGLALDDVTRILDVSSGRNHFSAHEDEAAVSFANWTETHQHFDASTSILGKDLVLAQQLAYASSGTFPFIEAACFNDGLARRRDLQKLARRRWRESADQTRSRLAAASRESLLRAAGCMQPAAHENSPTKNIPLVDRRTRDDGTDLIESRKTS